MLFSVALAGVVWSPWGEALFIESNFGIWLLLAPLLYVLFGIARRPLFRVPGENEKRIYVRCNHAHKAALQIDRTGWGLLVARDKGVSPLQGREAIRALALILPLINVRGASDAELLDAIDIIERVGGPEQLFATRLTTTLTEARRVDFQTID